MLLDNDIISECRNLAVSGLPSVFQVPHLGRFLFCIVGKFFFQVHFKSPNYDINLALNLEIFELRKVQDIFSFEEQFRGVFTKVKGNSVNSENVINH